MKVITLGTYLGNYNTYISQIQLLIGLKNSGADLTVVGYFSEEIKEVFEQAKVKLIEDHPSKDIDFSYISRIRKMVRSSGFDILHLFSGKTVKNGIFSTIGLPIKVVAYYGSLSLHWHDPTAYLKYLNPKINYITCNSRSVYLHVKKQLLNKSKAVHIYKGVDPKWFDEIVSFDYSTLGVPDDAVVVCMVANNRKVKDIPTFIKATYYFEASEKVYFVLIGSDTDTKEIHQLKEKSSAGDNIRLMGYRSDASSFIKATDIYVQTSLSEGLGRTTTEAMCFEKPIVMTDADGCTELVRGSNAGIIVPKQQPKVLAAEIKKLVKSKQLRLEMGKEARARIQSNFHINQNIEGVFDIYKKLIS